MSRIKKLFSLLSVFVVSVILILYIGSNQEVFGAEESGTERFNLKLINKGTGVEVVIPESYGAYEFWIWMSNQQNSYSKYLQSEGKTDRILGIEKYKGDETTFVINALVKGTYTFKVEGKTKNGSLVFSEEKTIKVKAPKTKVTEEKQYNFSKVKVGDIIKFGAYEQDGDMTNGKEDIEWIVLSKNKSQMLVVSKYVLDDMPFNTEDVYTTWATSSLRKWLNKVFYKGAFTNKEKSLIKKVTLKNVNNPYSGADGGSKTKDKVFLLSVDDVLDDKYGLGKNEDRKCIATDYEKTRTVLTKEIDGEYYTGWWLRTIGTNFSSYYQAIDVSFDGSFLYYGDEVIGYSGIRPAIYISLK